MSNKSIAEQIAELHTLKVNGALSEDEYERSKKNLLSKIADETSALSQSSVVDNPTLALVVYILYIVGYFTGISALVGVIMAHIQSSSDSGYINSHYHFQIRTFWIGLLYLCVGGALSFVVVGIPILIWWFVWSLIRIVKGIMLLNKQLPIAIPSSWGFGG